MRKRVEQLVDEYIRTTFDAAKDNITINGMETREIEEELKKAREGEGEHCPDNACLSKESVGDRCGADVGVLRQNWNPSIRNSRRKSRNFRHISNIRLYSLQI